MNIAEHACDLSNHPNTRMRKHGDLYRAPLTRTQMTAPLAWHEEQLPVVYRYGVLSTGAVGYARISR